MTAAAMLAVCVSLQVVPQVINHVTEPGTTLYRTSLVARLRTVSNERGVLITEQVC